MNFSKSVELPVTASEAFAWHERVGAFARLVPPWERVSVQSCDDGLVDGHRVEMEVAIGPLRKRWLAEIEGVEPGSAFSDVQLAGPFRAWKHRHLFEPLGPDRCRLTDAVDYEVPAGGLGRLVAGGMVAKKLERLFAWRHQVTLGDLALSAREGATEGLRVAVTGSSGLLGTTLVPFLTSQGHSVSRALRGNAPLEAGAVRYVPESGELGGDQRDVVIHLAGENIAARRWSSAQMERIRESRVGPTRALAESLAGMKNPPAVLLTASAIGFYGDRGAEVLDESSDAGGGFLAEVVRDWEEATRPAREAGIRVVNLRFGIILDPAGGALGKMLLPFRLGAGGPVGSGAQWMGWVSREDAVRAIAFCMRQPNIEGPVNVVSPVPATNRSFAKVLGRTLRRPAFMPFPAFAARLAFGPMADELLLSSTRAVPGKLQAGGFSFQHETLECALPALLGKAPPEIVA